MVRGLNPAQSSSLQGTPSSLELALPAVAPPPAELQQLALLRVASFSWFFLVMGTLMSVNAKVTVGSWSLWDPRVNWLSYQFDCDWNRVSTPVVTAAFLPVWIFLCRNLRGPQGIGGSSSTPLDIQHVREKVQRRLSLLWFVTSAIFLACFAFPIGYYHLLHISLGLVSNLIMQVVFFQTECHLGPGARSGRGAAEAFHGRGVRLAGNRAAPNSASGLGEAPSGAGNACCRRCCSNIRCLVWTALNVAFGVITFSEYHVHNGPFGRILYREIQRFIIFGFVVHSFFYTFGGCSSLRVPCSR